MRSVELFVGAGGMAMGVSRAGFSHDSIVEWDQYACDTLRNNHAQGVSPIAAWPEVVQLDVRKFDYSTITGKIDLVAGGPPCQPFSLGGRHRGKEDPRDMFPEAIRAVRELCPKAFFFENVRGLVRFSFADYLDYVLLQLANPWLTRDKGGSWSQHRSRLRKDAIGSESYRVSHRVLNAADYGVPQSRDRLIIVGIRSDLGVVWNYPGPTHSRDALLRDQWVTGEYWDRHAVPRGQRPKLPDSAASRVARLPSTFGEKPWLTVRDALSGLPAPSSNGDNGIKNHKLIPGARSYPGHTGSPLDLPAKTLKAGVHGVPGGENMLRHHNGRVRYFTVRESARLQCFPDEYEFPGTWGESMRQLGNAVPVNLGEVIAREIKKLIAKRAGDQAREVVSSVASKGSHLSDRGKTIQPT